MTYQILGNNVKLVRNVLETMGLSEYNNKSNNNKNRSRNNSSSNSNCKNTAINNNNSSSYNSKNNNDNTESAVSQTVIKKNNNNNTASTGVTTDTGTGHTTLIWSSYHLKGSFFSSLKNDQKLNIFPRYVLTHTII